MNNDTTQADPSTNAAVDLPLTDPTNENPNGTTSVSTPADTDTQADPNKTNNIEKVTTPATGTNSGSTAGVPLTSDQLRVAALASPGLVKSATTEAAEAPQPIDATAGAKEKADRDAMIDRRLSLIKRAFGATNFVLGDTTSEEQIYVLTDAAGNEVGSGTLSELSEQALEKLPPADEPEQDVKVPLTGTHSINNLDDLRGAVGAAGGDLNVEKIDDHYHLTAKVTDPETGDVIGYSGKVQVNANKDELTKFFRKMVAEFSKEIKSFENLVGFQGKI